MLAYKIISLRKEMIIVEKANYSIDNLLCDGKNSVLMNVGDMVNSLNTHHVTIEEVKSMEEEIENEPKFPGGGVIWTIATLFVTTFSNYLVLSSNSLIGALNARISKMGPKEFPKYWHNEGSKTLTRVSENISFLNVMSMIIWISLAIALALWIYFALRRTLLNRKRLQALYQYERQLLMQNHFLAEQPKRQSQASITIKRMLK